VVVRSGTAWKVLIHLYCLIPSSGYSKYFLALYGAMHFRHKQNDAVAIPNARTMTPPVIPIIIVMGIEPTKNKIKGVTTYSENMY